MCLVNLQLSFSSRLPLAVMESDFKNSSNSIISSSPSSSFLVFIVSKTYLQQMTKIHISKTCYLTEIPVLTRRILKDRHAGRTDGKFLWTVASWVVRRDNQRDIPDTTLWFLFWWLKHLWNHLTSTLTTELGGHRLHDVSMSMSTPRFSWTWTPVAWTWTPVSI